MKSLFKKYWVELILAVLLLLVYQQWIFHSTYLVAGDWIFHNQGSLLVFYRWPQLWDSVWGFGTMDILPVFDFIQLGYGVLAHFFNYAILERLFYFWPILIFSYIGIIKLGRLIFKDDKIGLFFFAILFLFNTYILSVQTGFITYANVYALSPIVFYTFIKLLNERWNVRNVLLASFSLMLCSFYEPRGLIALSYFLSIYVVYVLLRTKSSKIGVILRFVSTYIVFGTLNLYWVLPNFFSSSFNGIASTVSVFVPFNSLLDVFAYHNYAWQGNVFTDFRMVAFHKIPPSFYFFIVAMLTFSAVFFLKKIKRSQFVLFLLGSSLIGIFLLKQQNPPFGIVYEWLFHHMPTFNLFRESNKFLVFFLPISLLFGFSVSFLASKIKILSVKFIFLLSVTALVLINIVPVLNQQIQTLFIGQRMPEEYRMLNDIIFSQPMYSRNLFVPTDSNWIAYSDLHPKVGAVTMIQSDWMDFVNYKQHDNSWPEQDQIMDVFHENFSNQLFDISSIKYVIIPLQDKMTVDDLFFPYGGYTNPNIRQWYIDDLDTVEWLKKVDLGTKGIVVYENEQARDHLYTTKEQESVHKTVGSGHVDYTFVDPTEYQISLKNIKENMYINFSEKYHPGWRLRAGTFHWFDALIDKNYFLDAQDHSENDAKLNSFLINPEAIKQHVPKGNYIENPDGSIDLELTLYFKPQAYLNLGLIVSGAAMLGCIGVLGVDMLNHRKRKEKTEEEEDIEI
jgi:hypothetical protein